MGETRHKRWESMPFKEQMANIGSEVHRAITLADKGDSEGSGHAFERALTLISMSIPSVLTKPSRVRELTRLRELLIGTILEDRHYGSAEIFDAYFLPFALAARK